MNKVASKNTTGLMREKTSTSTNPPQFKVYVLTFATSLFASSARILRREFEAYPDIEFYQFGFTHIGRDFFRRRGLSWKDPGFGFWSWKHYLYGEFFLNKVREGDVVFWVDAGCLVISSAQARKRMSEYIELCRSSGALIFRTEHDEIQYTRASVCNLLGFEEGFHERNQRVGGVFGFVKNTKTLGLWNEILKVVNTTPELYCDAPDEGLHRHDQSIFSILTKVHKFKSIPDETYENGTGHAPIKAARRKNFKKYWFKIEQIFCAAYFGK